MSLRISTGRGEEPMYVLRKRKGGRGKAKEGREKKRGQLFDRNDKKT